MLWAKYYEPRRKAGLEAALKLIRAKYGPNAVLPMSIYQEIFRMSEPTGPIYNVYVTRDYMVGREKRTQWTKIGVVFAHEDGEGFNIQLEAAPLDGRLTLRKPKPREEQAAAGDTAASAPPATE